MSSGTGRYRLGLGSAKGRDGMAGHLRYTQRSPRCVVVQLFKDTTRSSQNLPDGLAGSEDDIGELSIYARSTFQVQMNVSRSCGVEPQVFEYVIDGPRTGQSCITIANSSTRFSNNLRRSLLAHWLATLTHGKETAGLDSCARHLIRTQTTRELSH